MSKRCFDIEREIADLKGYVAKAAKTGKFEKDVALGLLERSVLIIEELFKKIEALEDKLDLIEDKF